MRSLVAIVLMLAFQFGAPPQPASGIAGQFLLDGQPAGGVPIMVIRQDGSGPVGGIAGIATTDASGNYLVPVPPGSYHVRTGNAPITYYPGVPVVQGATAVVVESGKVKTGVTFGDSSERRRPSSSIFSPTPPNGFGQVLPQRSGVITGKYIVAGQPAPNVRIGALPVVTNGPFVQVVSQGITDSAGNFRLERLPAGSYHIRTLEGTGIYYPGVAGSVGAVAVVVEDNKVTEGINFQSVGPRAPGALPTTSSTAPDRGNFLPSMTSSTAPGFGGFPPSPGNLPPSPPLTPGIPGGIVGAPMGNQSVPPRPKFTVSTYAGIGPPYEDGTPGVQTSAEMLEAPSWILPDGAGGFFVTATKLNPTGVSSTAYAAVFQVSVNGRMERIAGSVAAVGFRGDGAPAQSALLRSPRGLARDAAGNLYIADAGNHRIRMVNRGVISTIAGNGTAGFSGDGGPAVSASLNNPSGIVVDAQGNLYIADTGNHRIRRVTPQGTISTLAGTGKEGLNGDGGPATLAWLSNPIGIAVDQEKNVFFADTNNHAIRMVTAKGVIWTVAGTATPGLDGDGGPAVLAHLQLPQAVAVDDNGVLTIADGRNHLIRRVTGGRPWTSFGPANATKPRIDTLSSLPSKPIPTPTPLTGSVPPDTRPAFMAVALEPGGSVLVVGDDLVYRLSSKGALAVVAGGAATPAEQPNGDGGPAIFARLRTPRVLAVDPSGNLFIAERFQQPGASRAAMIRKVTPAGIISTVATAFSFIQALAADSEGNLYVGDEGAIWKISPGGQPVLFAGSQGPVASATRPAGQIGAIRALAFDLQGNLLVAESNHRVSKIDRNTGMITVFAGGGSSYGDGGGPAVSAQVSDPSALAVDRLGNVFIAENGNGRIRKVNDQGIISIFAGAGPSQSASSEDGRPAAQAPLRLLKHLAVDTAGNVYLVEGVSSSYQHELRVRKVGTDGILVTVLGPTVQLKGITGNLGPSGLAVDAAGNLFVADETNNRVYKIVAER